MVVKCGFKKSAEILTTVVNNGSYFLSYCQNYCRRNFHKEREPKYQ